MKTKKRWRRTNRTNRRTQIAELLPKGNASWQFSGPYWGWQTKSVPQGYLQWVSREIDDLEQRDAADVELFRRFNAKSESNP